MAVSPQTVPSALNLTLDSVSNALSPQITPWAKAMNVWVNAPQVTSCTKTCVINAPTVARTVPLSINVQRVSRIRPWSMALASIIFLSLISNCSALKGPEATVYTVWINVWGQQDARSLSVRCAGLTLTTVYSARRGMWVTEAHVLIRVLLSSQVLWKELVSSVKPRALNAVNHLIDVQSARQMCLLCLNWTLLKMYALINALMELLWEAMTRTFAILVPPLVTPVQNLKPLATVVTMTEKLSRIFSSLRTLA